MGIVPLDRLITTVTTRLPATIAAAVQFELFSVLDEFLQNSSMWTDDVPFNTKVDVVAYRLAVSAGQIVRLKHVQDDQSNKWWAVMPTPGDLELNTAPSQVQRLTATFVLTVADPLTRDAYPLIPNWIATRYNQVLLDGLLGHMMSQSNKPYSNEQLATYHLRRFRNGIAGARTDALHDHTERAQGWAFPQTFATRRKRP